MRKIIQLLTLGIISLTLSTSVYAQADVPPVGEGSQRFFCLSAAMNGGHTSKLNIDTAKYTPIPGQVYVMVRINGSMTTGNSALDDKIYGNHNGLTTLQGSVGIKNAGVKSGNPVSDPSAFPVDWHDDLNAEDASDHYWFGMQIAPPVQAADNGGAGALQNGTFNWAVSESNKDCASIRWDPLGYVFDAQTLGVIPGATVTIYDANKTPATKVPVGPLAGMVAANPFLTLADGKFSFFTEAGTYTLTIEGKYNGKNLVMANPATVNTTYKSAGYTNLYQADSKIIEEEGQTVRTDIAVQTVGAPAPLVGTPMLNDENIIGGGEQMLISGQVLNYTPAAPNAKVVLLYQDPVTQQSQESPMVIPLDANGRFKFNAPQALEDNPSYVVSQLSLKLGSFTAQNTSIIGRIKSYLTHIFDSLFSVQAAQATSFMIDPIPSYIEGIAKDANGKIMSSATVGIYVQGNSKPSYQTKSDINGHYVVGSQFIPPLQYEIRLTNVTGEVVKLTTREYLKQNSAYLTENKISPFSVVSTTTSLDDSNTLVVKKTVIPQNGGKTGTNSTKTPVKGNPSDSLNNQSNTTTTTPGMGSQGIIMIVVAIFMLVLIGIGAFIMLRSKQQQMPPMQM